MHIRKSGFSIGLIALAVLSTGCSTSNLRSDYDRSADFGSYETYNFMENAGPRSGNYESFFSQYMVEAITIEMEKRGYVKADDPDIWVNFNGILQEKTSVRSVPASPPMGGYYGYRGGYYDPWRGYGIAEGPRESARERVERRTEVLRAIPVRSRQPEPGYAFSIM
jgi:hypothetical protein